MFGHSYSRKHNKMRARYLMPLFSREPLTCPLALSTPYSSPFGFFPVRKILCSFINFSRVPSHLSKQISCHNLSSLFHLLKYFFVREGSGPRMPVPKAHPGPHVISGIRQGPAACKVPTSPSSAQESFCMRSASALVCSV